VDLDERGHSDRFEELLVEMVPRYLELNGEFDFDNVLAGYWLFEQTLLGANIPVLATSVEMLKRAWYSSARSKSRGVYMPKEEFEELLEEELNTMEEKLRETEYGDRMVRRMRNAYNFGANESIEFFLGELGLPIGPVERSAMRARNPMAHGSATLLDESRHQETINNTLAYRTLFNRIMLKILGYDGAYVDYATMEWPDRPLGEPLAGR
jgi:predicted metal-dependent hydrolase